MIELSDADEEIGLVDFPRSFTNYENKLSQPQVEELNTIMDFMLLVDLTRLTWLEAVTSNFTRLPYEGPEDIQMGDLDPLFEQYAEMEARQAPVSAAVENLQQRAWTSVKAEAYSDSPIHKVQRVMSPKRLISLMVKIKNFFTKGSAAADNAKNEMLAAYQKMSPDQRNEAFEMVEDSNRAGARNFEEYIGKLRNGEVPYNAVLGARKDLYADWGYQAAAQTPNINRPCLNTAHREGSELVKAGAEVYVEAIKSV
ncbi:MAG: hypothetical protein FD147_2090, partial [Chloroflexi bacterium]